MDNLNLPDVGLETEKQLRSQAEPQSDETEDVPLPAMADLEPVKAEHANLPDVNDLEPIANPNMPLPAMADLEPVVHKDYSTAKQKAITALEGAAEGATFGLSVPIEEKLGLATKEDIRGREQENPFVHAGASALGTVGSTFVPGVGEGWILAKGAEALLPIAKEMNSLAKVGRLALRGALEMSGMATGDELSDAFLGKQAPTSAIVGHIVGSGAMGLLTGGAFGAGTEALKAIQDAKLGKYLDDFAIGLGAAAQGEERINGLLKFHEKMGYKTPKAFMQGIKFYNETSSKIGKAIAEKVTEGGSAKLGAAVGGLPGALQGIEIAKKYLDPYADKLASKVSPSITKRIAVPIMLQAIKTGKTVGLVDALNYGSKAAKGLDFINKAVEGLFKPGSEEVFNYGLKDTDDDRLNEYIEDGGINQEIQSMQSNPDNYAKGGTVRLAHGNSNGIQDLYPDQHMALTITKGKVANYLNSIRPSAAPKLAFDVDHKDVAKERNYREALSIANAPLQVLKDVKKGTVVPSQIMHLNSMYPDLYSHLSQKITRKIVEHQSEETKPPHKTRQGLSMFLGAPLESNFTPSAIQAAQAVFITAKPQQPANKTNALNKLAKSYETPDQSRTKHRNKD